MTYLLVYNGLWLIVTQTQDSPATPVNSNSSSALSDPSAPWLLSEETDSGSDPAYYSAEKAQLGDGKFYQSNSITRSVRMGLFQFILRVCAVFVIGI